MRYHVNIEFKKGASFSCDVDAVSEKFAEQQGVFDARISGYHDAVKKVSASPVIEQEEGSDA